MEVIPLDKNEKVPLKNKSNNDLSSNVSEKPKELDQVPEPHGGYGAQIDSDLENY